jgi:hypothetical protein
MRISGWIQGLALYGAILGALGLWHFEGVEGAKNVVLVLGWASAALGICAGIMSRQAIGRPDISAPKGTYRVFEIVAKVAIVLALAWCGLLILSAACIVGWLCIEIARKPKEVSCGR